MLIGRCLKRKLEYKPFISFDTQSFRIRNGKVELGAVDALLSSHRVPTSSLSIVLFDAVAVVVQNPKIVLNVNLSTWFAAY